MFSRFMPLIFILAFSVATTSFSSDEASREYRKPAKSKKLREKPDWLQTSQDHHSAEKQKRKRKKRKVYDTSTD